MVARVCLSLSVCRVQVVSPAEIECALRCERIPMHNFEDELFWVMSKPSYVV